MKSLDQLNPGIDIKTAVLFEEIKSGTKRAQLSLDVATDYLATFIARLQAWNERYGLSRRILIMDSAKESESVALHLREHLRVEVDVTASHDEALASWSREKHAVVLVDFVMNGVEFIKQIGRGPKVLLLVDDESDTTPLNITRRTARNLNAKVTRRIADTLANDIRPMMDSVVPPSPEEDL